MIRSRPGPATRKLQAASRVGASIEKIYGLVEAGADVDAVDEHGNTPIHLALLAPDGPITARYWSVVFGLVHSGANPDIANHAGNSPLHLALDCITRTKFDGYSHCLEFLVHHGADLSLPDAAGRTPAQAILEHPRLFSPELLASATACRLEKSLPARPPGPPPRL